MFGDNSGLTTLRGARFLQRISQAQGDRAIEIRGLTNISLGGGLSSARNTRYVVDRTVDQHRSHLRWHRPVVARLPHQ